ncbi:MAG: hypothetical protein K0U93_30845 [Gammaproteobacteria bacterium]|nr:hypothetical protein [Gammaproteobacteria bacterium]
MAEIRKRTPGARGAILMLVVLVAVIAVLSRWVLMELAEWIESEPAKVGTRIYAYVWVLLLLGTPGLIAATYFWKVAQRTVRSEEYPPPGQFVLRDTPVLHGVAATQRARRLQIVAVLFVVIFVGIPIAFGVVASRIIS